MKTLTQSIHISGIGIHNGTSVDMVIRPDHRSGIYFKVNKNILRVSPDTIGIGHYRSTQLVSDGMCIQTPEHFLSACYALSVSHISVELSCNEVPILDGSSRPFIEALSPYLIEISGRAPVLKVPRDDIFLTDSGSTYCALPRDEFRITGFIS